MNTLRRSVTFPKLSLTSKASVLAVGCEEVVSSGVPVRTGSLPQSDKHPAVVLGCRYWLKMRRVNAPFLAAQMIKMQASRDSADGPLVGDAVGVLRGPTTIPESAVTLVDDASGPDPAPIGSVEIDLVPEQFGAGRLRHVGSQVVGQSRDRRKRSPGLSMSPYRLTPTTRRCWLSGVGAANQG